MEYATSPVTLALKKYTPHPSRKIIVIDGMGYTRFRSVVEKNAKRVSLSSPRNLGQQEPDMSLQRSQVADVRHPGWGKQGSRWCPSDVNVGSKNPHEY